MGLSDKTGNADKTQENGEIFYALAQSNEDLTATLCILRNICAELAALNGDGDAIRKRILTEIDTIRTLLPISECAT